MQSRLIRNGVAYVVGNLTFEFIIDGRFASDGQFGVAVLLRIAGGVAMLQDPRLVEVSTGNPVVDATQLPAGPAARTPRS